MRTERGGSSWRAPIAGGSKSSGETRQPRILEDRPSQTLRLGTSVSDKSTYSGKQTKSSEDINHSSQRISEDYSSRYLLKKTKRLKAQDKWIGSRRLPRVVGGIFCALPVAAVILGFGLSLGCPSCYSDKRGSQVKVPERFTISDTLRESPTRWTGLVLFGLTSICAFILGAYRFTHMQEICLNSFPKLLVVNVISAHFGFLFCVCLVGVVSIRPGGADSAWIHIRMGLIFCQVLSLMVYLILQHGSIERTLVKYGIVRSSSHSLRFLLFLVAGISELVCLPLMVLRTYFEDDSGSLAESLVFGSFHLILEFAAMLHFVVAVGLTDFSSVAVNVTKLEGLQSIVYKASKGVICRRVEANGA